MRFSIKTMLNRKDYFRPNIITSNFEVVWFRPNNGFIKDKFEKLIEFYHHRTVEESGRHGGALMVKLPLDVSRARLFLKRNMKVRKYQYSPDYKMDYTYSTDPEYIFRDLNFSWIVLTGYKKKRRYIRKKKAVEQVTE